MQNHINAKEAFALAAVLRGAQVLVDNQAVVWSFDLQVREGFWLRLQWVPTEHNVDAGRIRKLEAGGDYRIVALLWGF